MVERYGRSRPSLDVDELRAATEARGFPLEERHAWGDGIVEYWEPTSRMGLIAVSDPEEAGQGAPAGAVLKMLSAGTDSSAWARFREREDSFEGYVSHLLALTEARRIAWLDEHNLMQAASGPTGGPIYGSWSDAAGLSAGRALGPADIRLSRTLRNQIHEVGPALPHLKSAAVADDCGPGSSSSPSSCDCLSHTDGVASTRSKVTR